MVERAAAIGKGRIAVEQREDRERKRTACSAENVIGDTAPCASVASIYSWDDST